MKLLKLGKAFITDVLTRIFTTIFYYEMLKNEWDFFEFCFP